MIRLFDIVFATFALVALSPLLIIVMAVLLLTGEHEVFYLQKRIGKGGKPFHVFKFATMQKESPALTGGFLTRPDDPRVLPVGRVLRKWKINELPQFFNVVAGQMSMVGPRPQASVHYELFADDVAATIDQLSPGLTGLGSLIFRDEEALLEASGMEIDYVHDQLITPYKGELEKWYAENRSIFMYFKILVLTAVSLVMPNLNYLQFFVGAPNPGPELQPVLDYRF